LFEHPNATDIERVFAFKGCSKP